MGLDMYLSCNDQKFVRQVDRAGMVASNECIDLNSNSFEFAGLGEWSLKLGIICYWRKANAIHNWFVENIQEGVDDCGTYEVSLNQLAELRDACNQVLEASNLKAAGKTTEWELTSDGLKEKEVDQLVVEDTSVAEELLPTTTGLFFGGTNYDKYYLHDVEFTRNRLNDILSHFKKDEVGYYDPTPEFSEGWITTFTYQASW